MDSNPICARETHVSGQLNEARKLTGALHSQMQILREKLNPVFRNEPSYRQDAAGELESTRVLTDVRVSMSPAQLRRMARAMSKTAEEAEVQMAKALRDHAARWAAAQPNIQPPQDGTTNKES